MKAPRVLSRKWTPEQLAELREIQREYHVRAFGEELARVNLDMTKQERIEYLAWMRKNAERHGVSFKRPLPYGEESDFLDEPDDESDDRNEQ